MNDKNNLKRLKDMLFMQLDNLDDIPIDSSLDDELKKAKATNEIASTIVDIANIDKELIKLQFQTGRTFGNSTNLIETDE